MVGRRHLSSVVAAFRSWHVFAVSILCCGQCATLPPAREADVSRWAAVFAESGHGVQVRPQLEACMRKSVGHHRMAWCGIVYGPARIQEVRVGIVG